MPDTSYQPKVYRKRGGDELVVASGGKVTVETGGEVNLESPTGLLDGIVRNVRVRSTVAEIKAGKELLPALDGFKYRMVDCLAIAIGGAAGAVTTVDILGTQTSGVKLVALAQANLTQSAVLRAGGTGAAVLADGASFEACDANTAITIGKTGSDITTATHIDAILSYVVEAE